MPTSNTEAIIFIIATTSLILLLAVFIITILYLYQKKQLSFQKNLEAIKLNHEKNILQTQLEIQEQTLQDVSRDIHDNISLSLTLCKLHLNTLNYPRPVPFQEKIDLSVSLITEAIHNLRNISKSLNADIIKHNGLLKAVENEIGKLSKTGLFQIQYEIKGNPVFMECQKELVLFRIIQESFNNIIKHAHAGKINLILNYSLHKLDMCIQDNGIGFLVCDNQEKMLKLTSGLNNIRQRAIMIESECEIRSEPGKGTTIEISVPYKTESYE